MEADERGKAEAAYTHLKIHFFYVSVILCGVIVLLATRDWTTLQGFTDYLSVAATITSLVLGILAIIYSFVSSSSMNGSLGLIESSANDMRKIGTELRTVLSGGQTLQAKAETRNEELHSLIGSLRVAVETISNKTKEIAGAIEVLPSQFGELRDEVRKRTQTDPPQKLKEELEALWNADHLAGFLANASLLGLVAIKALVDASVSHKYCDLRALFDDETVKSFEYVYGFLVCSSSAGILKYEYPADGALNIGKARMKEPSADLIRLTSLEWAKRKARDKSGKSAIGRYVTKIEESYVEES